MVPTADLCDANEARIADGRLLALSPGWLQFGRRIAFAGPHSGDRWWRQPALRAGGWKSCEGSGGGLRLTSGEVSQV